MTPKQRKWVMVVVVYSTTRVLGMDAVRDSILAAAIGELLKGKKINRK